MWFPRTFAGWMRLGRLFSAGTVKRRWFRKQKLAVEQLEPRTLLATLVGLTATNALITFDSATPGTITNNVGITGLQGGETVLGIDYRPADGQLYALGSNARLYTLNPTTGVASFVAPLTADGSDTSSPFAGLNGTSFGVDFNPVPDRLRVVSNTGQNLRINPATGATITDGNLNPGTPLVTGSAYTNSFPGTTGTTLFAIDSGADQLFTQTPPNDGTLVPVGAGLGVGDVSPTIGFDIQAFGNAGFAAMTTDGVASSLYTVDTVTGAANLVAAIGAAPTLVTGLAIKPAGALRFSSATYSAAENSGSVTITINRVGGSEGTVSAQVTATDGTATSPGDYTFTPNPTTVTFGPGVTTQTVVVSLVNDVTPEDLETVNLALSNPTGDAVLGVPNTAVLTIADDEVAPALVVAVDSFNNLLRFNAATPGVIMGSTPITGLQGGEFVLGIDYRPATGELYLLGSNARLYTLNTSTAAATFVAALTADGSDTTSPFTTLDGTSFGVDFNPVPDRLRVVSNTGQNLRINPANGLVITDDTITPAGTVTGSAYLNSFAGTPTTTLFGIDAGTDSLVIQNPPNNGVITPVGGGLGIGDISPTLGFDIRTIAGANRALASLITADNVSKLYTIDLTTGTAALIGQVGGPNHLVGLAMVPVGFSNTDLNGSTVTFNGSPGADTLVFDQSGGLLRHNRFLAGDPGFASPFDFDPATPGDQTLSATDPAVLIIVNGGDGDDRVIIGSAVAPASSLAAAFQINGQGGNDALVLDDTISVTGRNITVNGTVGNVTGLSGTVTHTTLEGLVVNAGTGNDTINLVGVSTSVATSINAGAGNDTVFMGVGASLASGVIDGGTGANFLSYSAFGAPVTVDLSAGQTAFLANLSGAQEPGPFSTSNATGIGVFVLNAAQTALTFAISYTGLQGATITGAHFHNAATGVNGPIVRGLVGAELGGSTVPNGTMQGVWASSDTAPLTPALVAELLAGRIYVNIHTNLFPSGEIRGQLLPQGLVFAATGTAGIRGFDNLIGSNQADQFIGGINPENVIGGPGADTFFGGGGDDTFTWNPGDGNDVFEGQAGTADVHIFNGSAGAESFTLNAVGARFELLRNLGNIDMDLAGVEVIELNALGGNDTITVNSLVGTGITQVNLRGGDANDLFNLVASAGITIQADGGAQTGVPGDTMILQAGTATTVTHTFTNENDGSVSVDGALINYTGLEPIQDNLNAVNRIFTYSGSSETITFGDDTVAGNGMSFIDSTSGEAVTFINPSASLTINAGGGDDQVTLKAADSQFAATLNVNGDGGNDVIFGSDAAENVFGNTGADTFFGGGGNDTFTWNPGDGNDTYEGGAGTDVHVFNGAAGAESFTLNAVGGRFELLRNLGNIDMDIAGVEQIDLNALGGNDTITVNNLAGTGVTQVNLRAGDGDDQFNLTASAGVTLLADGGGQATAAGDSLNLQTGTATTVTHTFTNETDGTVSVDGALINYSALEAIQDNLNAANRVFTYSDAAETITLSDNATSSDSISLLDSTTGQALTFLSPSASLTINAGGGEDVVLLNGRDAQFAAVVNVNGGAGNDRIVGTTFGANVFGNTGADSFFGGTGNDTFTWNPGDGNDLFEGGAGTDVHVFNGAAGAESFTLNAVGTRFELLRNLGNIDMDLAGVERIELNALGGNDTVTINNLTATEVTQVVVNAGEGDDDVSLVTAGGGLNAAFQINGQGGNDALTIDDSASTAARNLILDAGAGTVAGLGGSISSTGIESLALNVGSGADLVTVTGKSTNATALTTGAGNDTVAFAAGASLQGVDGGTGTNTLNYAAFGAAVTVDLAAGTAPGTSGVSGFDNVIGSAFGDTLSGNANANVFIGGDGNDNVLGRAGADSFFGGAGNDTFTWNPGDGNDLFEGEAGTDVHVFNGSGGAESFTLNAVGTRFELLRNVGNIDMDLGGVEQVEVNALGGNDTITVNSLSGTDVRQVNVRAGDGEDLLTVAGSSSTTVTVDGGPHVVGDVLTFNAQNQSFTLSSDSITGAGQPVTFRNIEAVSASNQQLSADQKFVQAQFVKFLGRTGSTAELDSWVAQLPTLGKEGIARGIARAEAALNLVVGEFYERYLNRTGRPDELKFWVDQMLAGATDEKILSGILASPEFSTRAQLLFGPGNSADENYVRGLYQILFNRVPSAAEVSFWLAKLPADGREGVALGFLTSEEYRGQEVRQYYVELLNRQTPPLDSEVEFWVKSGLDLRTIRARFTSSEEFVAKS